MSLVGNTVKEQIWNFLRDKGMSKWGVAGLMGNLFAESGLNPKNLQNGFEKKLGMTDESYTQAVDAGTYGNFVRDSAGYGLAQWTYWSRKQNMLDYASKHNKSIGDLEMQLAFLFEELSESYPSVLAKLKSARSVKTASDAVLTEFEKPADQGSAAKAKRAEYGQKYFDEFAGAESKPQNGGSNMTEAQVRQKVLGIMQGWVKLKKSDKSHAPIIDTYNGNKPLPRGYEVSYNDAYCATTVSAAAIKAGYTDIMPVECSCYYLIEQAKKMGIWQENDAYVPNIADEVLYDWQDNGIGDNTGNPDHVGMVEKVVGNTITVIEGNMSGGVVGRRNLQVNGKYIRGYICPKYSSKATPGEKSEVNAGGSLKVGDVVNFTGNKQYTSSYSGGKKKDAKPCQARVTAISEGKPHPYHLVAISGGKVYGWVDASDIEGASSGSKEFAIGDSVQFTGTTQYTSSYKGAKAVKATACKASVTAVNKNGVHQYHLKGDGVYGWVDASYIAR